MAKQLKKWQGWLLFAGAMVAVFLLGLICSSLLERRAEVASVFNNRRVQMNDSIVAQNEKFAEDFPRELFGTDMPSRANTIRRADTGIVLKTCGKFCVREVQA